MRKQLEKFTVYDLVIIAIMSALGIALKTVVVPLAHIIAGPLMIPSGAFAGGLYMMWLVVGYGMVRKPGTATLIGIVQAFLVMFTGVIGSHGIMSLFTYIMPGLVMDIVLLIIGHRACCRACCVIAGAAANMTGTACVNVVFFQAPGMYLILILSVAALSGAIGGYISWELLRVADKYHMIKNKKEEQKKFKNSRRVLAAIMCVILVAAGITGVANYIDNKDNTTGEKGYSLTVGYEDTVIKTFTAKELKEMPSIEKKVFLSSSSKDDVDGKYKGVPLSYLINRADPGLFESCENVLCVAGDGYTSAFTMDEVLEENNLIVAYEMDGKSLEHLDEGGTGPLRIVALKDSFGNRSVKYVTKIECLE